MLFKLPYQSTECKEYIDSLQWEWVATIEKPKRTPPQNRTYWDNVEILANYIGLTKQAMSNTIKHWITQRWDLKLMNYYNTTQWVVQDPISTADLDSKEFGILMDYVFQLWHALNLQMHDPNLLEYANDLFSN